MGKSDEYIEYDAYMRYLKKVTVEYYGSSMPIDQVASITTPDARTAASE